MSLATLARVFAGARGAAVSGTARSVTSTSVVHAKKPRLLSPEDIVAMSKPSFVHGKWRKPQLGPRAINKLRQGYEAMGEPFVLPRKPIKIEKPRIKGQKHVIRKEERLIKIEKNMKSMPAQVAEHREKQREKRILAREAKLHFPHPR